MHYMERMFTRRAQGLVTHMLRQIPDTSSWKYHYRCSLNLTMHMLHVPLWEFKIIIKYWCPLLYSCHLYLWCRTPTKATSWTIADLGKMVLTLKSVRSTLQEFDKVIFVLKETMGCQQHSLCGRHLLVNDNKEWGSNCVLSLYSTHGTVSLPFLLFIIAIITIIVFEVWHLSQSAACLLFHTCRLVNLAD